MMKPLLFNLLILLSFNLFAQTNQLTDRLVDLTGLKEENFLIQGFSEVNREDFLPREYRGLATETTDIPLRAYVLAPSPVTLIKLFLAGGLKESHRVLLVGEESAYAATALSRAGMEVYLIDPEAPASSSYQLKKDLDDLKGWISMAPFDFILILNDPKESVPTALMDQLAQEGVLIVPLISPSNKQDWIKIKLRGDDWEISIMDGAYTLPLF